MPHHESPPSVPCRLLARLDRLGAELEARGDALGLIGLGSVGLERDRLDEHSDADFFLVVPDAAAKTRYLQAIDWLEALAAVSFSFENSTNGRKVLFADGLFMEYAVFTVPELKASPYPAGRLVWRRADAPEGLEIPGMPPPGVPGSVDYHVNEALTNLFVGLHRDLRGERLSATRFIQGYAVDRLLTVLGLLRASTAAPPDPFAVERRAERRFTPAQLPLDQLVPGYRRNAVAAKAVMRCLGAHVSLDPAMAAAVHDLIGRVEAASDQGRPGQASVPST